MTEGRKRNLVRRAGMMRALRGFFEERDFLEVETPVLVPTPGLEVHLKAVGADGGYLITSPEYQMKRLLVGGLERIYQVCKCFRAGEEGRHHSSEFTMLEWYRAGAELDEIVADTEALVAHVATAAHGRPVVHVAGRAFDVTPPWPRMTVAQAMAQFAGIELKAGEPAATLAARVRAAGVDLGTATAWDDVFFTAWVERVDPALAALPHPIIVEAWPVELAALARRIPGAPHLAERFEAYIGGLELCNAFGELTDPVEQRARFELDLAQRRARGFAEYPIDEAFLAALAEGMPAASGIALGVDRLAMLLCDSEMPGVLTFSANEL
ncbi:MAG: EF-P lysine aminoacylase GenX [Myxococcales bacterium]|nr:EF-P lysine aminoacylase GenX [Myxococcales bacterium]